MGVGLILFHFFTFYFPAFSALSSITRRLRSVGLGTSPQRVSLFHSFILSLSSPSPNEVEGEGEEPLGSGGEVFSLPSPLSPQDKGLPCGKPSFVLHARCRREGSAHCGENRYHDLNHLFPKIYLFHLSVLFFFTARSASPQFSCPSSGAPPCGMSSGVAQRSKN